MDSYKGRSASLEHIQARKSELTSFCEDVIQSGERALASAEETEHQLRSTLSMCLRPSRDPSLPSDPTHVPRSDDVP
jgi:hypothetical protein